MSAAPPDPQSVRVQIEALRGKLLDLSLRNRMLNYKPSKRLGVTVIGEDSTLVHKSLVEIGKKMSFTGEPDPARGSAKHRDPWALDDDDVAMEQFRRAAEDEMDAFLEIPGLPPAAMDTKFNTTDVESVLQAKLRMILREATLAREELGINTLFLTLGSLEWSESEQRSFRAPLIFVPVRLEQHANGAMRLVHDGSDVGSNLPLKAKLTEFNLKLPEYDDDKPLPEFFSEVESTIASRADWHVHRNEVCLGFFNYEKYAMYIDLGGDAWPEDKKPWRNPDLAAMLGGGYSSPDSPMGDDTFLDPIRPVEQAHEVFDADASQTIAMMRAAEGLSIVVEGPPGTGKSQTITNMIAEAVAAGKSVLFVSAKRAALEVVKRNLERADLGAICLDLHDRLTNRREFYAELKRTVNRSVSVQEEQARVARLTELRNRLNSHCRAVNEPLPAFGASPFHAMSILARLPAEAPEDREGRIPFEALQRWKAHEIEFALPQIEALQTRLRSAGVPSQNPFWGTEIDYVDPSLRLDLDEELTAAQVSLTEAVDRMTRAADALRVQIGMTAANVGLLSRCVEQAAAAPPHDGIAMRTSDWKDAEGPVRETVEALKTRIEIRAKWSRQVRPEIWGTDLVAIDQAYERFASAWYKPLIGAYRRARQNLEPYLAPEAPVDPNERRQLVHEVRSVQDAESLVGSKQELMRRLMGALWQELDTDPLVAARLLEWVLEVDRKTSSGVLPPGLIDFFAGNHNTGQVQELTKNAEWAANEALRKYRGAAGLLKFESGNAEEEELGALLGRVEGWHRNLGRLAEYVACNEARHRLIERGLGPLVEVGDRWPLASDRLQNAFLRSYYLGVVREAIAARPELKSFEREGHEAAIREFQSLDDFKLKYNRACVRLAHQRGLPSFENAVGNLHVLKLQCELQRSQKPIRWVLQRAGEAVQRIKPVFMMSPLSVAIHLPPELPAFDMVIFDEASQIRPEDSLCAIVRAKQSIVVGDTRQMPPTSFFDRLVDDDDLTDDDTETGIGAEARKLESVLSLMSAVTLGRVRRPDLRWHYRSVHPSLIEPSNEMFYDGRLIVFPSAGDVRQGQKVGVVFHHHPETVYEAGSRNRVNREEAKIVADHVLAHVRESAKQSLLVAAMNKPQADLIYAEVQSLERADPAPFQRYRELHPHEPLDIKNLENVQGDERDVIFISVTYGKDAGGVLRQQFGPLLVDGGERRLNVLITRARMRCEVFSNISSDDIRVEGLRPGVMALKRYLRFAKDGFLDVPLPTGGDAESPFEEEVSAALINAGYQVHSQVGTEGYRIDLGVIDRDRPGSYVLGVECDGATYHRAKTARDRDKLRQRVLEARGWRIHRIWSNDWWQDREGEVRRLIAAIESTDTFSAKPDEPNDEPAVIVAEAPRTNGGESRTRPYVTAPTRTGITTDVALGAYMVEVVEAEGPIHRELLTARLREATGFARAGSNVKALLERVMAQNGIRVQFLVDAYYATDDQIKTPRDWSTRPSHEKKADWVSEAEIAAGLRAVVTHSFGANEEEAVKAAFNLLGFKRVTESATLRARHVIDRMLENKGLVKRSNGQLSRPD